MSVPYNPFELLNLPTLKELLRKDTRFLVVQRLQWPGLAYNKGFIATPYQLEKPAKEHAQKLGVNEGRMIDLKAEIGRVMELIESPKYLFFLNTCRDDGWEDRLLKHYQKNILSTLNTTAQIQDLGNAGIELSFKFGKLTAIIQTEDIAQEYSLYDLIK